MIVYLIRYLGSSMPSLNALPWKDFITFGAALLGACLGVMNTWNAINQRRVRLRVRPTHAFAVPNAARMFCIEVINLSTFPVTISEVGFTTRHWIDRGDRLAVVGPLIIDGRPWPRRLETREAVSVYFSPSDVLSQRKPIGRVYARTSCDEVAYGTSPALKQLQRAAK